MQILRIANIINVVNISILVYICSFSSIMREIHDKIIIMAKQCIIYEKWWTDIW